MVLTTRLCGILCAHKRRTHSLDIEDEHDKNHIQDCDSSCD